MLAFGFAASLLGATTAARADATPTPQETAQANKFVESGSRHFDLQEWDAAISDFKQAYQLVPAADLIFNIAQAQRLKGDCQAASVSYRTYLREAPNSSRQKKVEQRLQEMESCAKQPATTTTPPAITTTPPGDPKVVDPGPTPQPPPSIATVITKPPDVPDIAPAPQPTPMEKPQNRSLAIPVTLGAVGLVVLGTGGYFAYDGHTQQTKLNDLCKQGCDGNAARAIDDRGHASNVKAVTLAAVGGGLLISAVVYAVVTRNKAHHAPSVALLPSPQGAAVQYSIRF